MCGVILFLFRFLFHDGYQGEDVDLVKGELIRSIFFLSFVDGTFVVVRFSYPGSRWLYV